MIPADSLEIVTLSENTARGRGILGEWGLSILVKAADCRILLDTGAGLSAAHNADPLGVDLTGIDAIVLSHGHYDHTGGLAAVLARIGREIRVVAHPEVWGRKYGRNKTTGKYRYAGIPFSREALEDLGARFELSREPTWLSEDVAAGGEEPMKTDFEEVADGLFVKEGDRFVPDPVIDDQSLFLRTELGLVVILGCAHRGMINIVEYGRELMGQDRVYLVLGGTHLVAASDAQLEQTIDALCRLEVAWIGVSHCTGQRQAARLMHVFGDRFFFNNAGSVLRFPLSA